MPLLPAAIIKPLWVEFAPTTRIDGFGFQAAAGWRRAVWTISGRRHMW